MHNCFTINLEQKPESRDLSKHNSKARNYIKKHTDTWPHKIIKNFFMIKIND